jgi:hypothetical protein
MIILLDEIDNCKDCDENKEFQDPDVNVFNTED